MIKRHSDHAANERTFLAWVRTAIATTAVGFLIERFDLFLRFAAPQIASASEAIADQSFAGLAGLAFVLLGMAMIMISALRFMRTAKQIDSGERALGPGVLFDVAPAALRPARMFAAFVYSSRRSRTSTTIPGGKAE